MTLLKKGEPGFVKSRKSTATTDVVLVNKKDQKSFRAFGQDVLGTVKADDKVYQIVRFGTVIEITRADSPWHVELDITAVLQDALTLLTNNDAEEFKL
ncbi:MAG TPA: hypothetical protein VKB76_11290 [Ktedonobacterales bacterium]|nr:hypothetical protein [Ktedonobacterales bacterium]